MRVVLEVGIYLAALMIMAFSVLVVTRKTAIYSALFLALLGLVNAALFFALGYPFIAFVQIVVYVGASVLFLIISISMLKEPKEEITSPIYPVVGGIAALALGIILVYELGSSINILPASIGYLEAASSALSRGGLAFGVLFLLLALAMVVSVTVALGGKKNE